MIHIPNSVPDKVFNFVRQNSDDKVFVVLNFSAQAQHVTFEEWLYHGTYTDYFADVPVELGAAIELALAPWGYKVSVT